MLSYSVIQYIYLLDKMILTMSDVFDVDELLTIGKGKPNGIAIREGEISSNGSLDLNGEKIEFTSENNQVNGPLKVTSKITSEDIIKGKVGTFEEIKSTGEIKGKVGTFEEIKSTAKIFCNDGYFNRITLTGNFDKPIDDPLVTTQYIIAGKGYFKDWYFPFSQELKQDIFPLSKEEAYSLFEALEPIKYSLKNDPNREENIGFSSENVPDIFTTKDHTNIRYFQIISVLTKVIKDQQKRIESLEKSVHIQS